MPVEEVSLPLRFIHDNTHSHSWLAAVLDLDGIAEAASGRHLDVFVVLRRGYVPDLGFLTLWQDG